jgi:hypothetical protein
MREKARGVKNRERGEEGDICSLIWDVGFIFHSNNQLQSFNSKVEVALSTYCLYLTHAPNQSKLSKCSSVISSS